MSELRPQAAELAAAVSERELSRLLGLPRGRALAGDTGALADAARGWYAAHGRPFAASARAEAGDVPASLRETRSHAVAAIAVSAGREAAAEVGRLWASDRPDLAFVLDRFATAVTEALVFWTSGALCRAASRSGETLLPARSPGCGHFDMASQHELMRLLGGVPAADGRLALGPIELLPTGALDPPHSLLAALGVTRETLAAATPEDLCRSCALEPCAFRRAPARRPTPAEQMEAR